MNKTKTILAAVGGVTLVAVAAAGYFAWSAYAAKTAAREGNDDGVEGLESVQAKAGRLMAKPIYPGAESVRLLTEASDAVKAWKDEAFTVATRGDRRIQPTTDAAFKEFIVGDAHRLQGLPAGADHKMLAENFDFGPFRPYISEGKMPELASLGELQRKWDDVATLIETLADCGVEGVTAVELATVAAPKEEEPTGKKAKGKAKVKAKEKAKAKGETSQTASPLSYTYVITCKMRPSSLVKALNAFATCERYTVVSDFTLQREKDAIAEGLGAEKKADAPAATTGRRRRRGAAAEKTEEAKPNEEADSRVTLVTEPSAEEPFVTKLTVEVIDFRSAEKMQEKSGEEASK